MIFKLKGKAPEKKSDKELLREFVSGKNPDVLGELYSRYMTLVYGVCLKYLKDRDESKDAVIQIFEKLINEIPKQRIDNFRSWLHVVTKNYCLMQLRFQKTHNEHMQAWMEDSVIFMENDLQMHPIDSDDPDIDNALTDCIERLKGEQKACIHLFYYENRCYKEIAGKLDLDEKKVKSYLQNAKRNLKLCLEEKHVGQEQI
jgi:RNA polymerase sigma-70 factor (ECF subfamily)